MDGSLGFGRVLFQPHAPSLPRRTDSQRSKDGECRRLATLGMARHCLNVDDRDYAEKLGRPRSVRQSSKSGSGAAAPHMTYSGGNSVASYRGKPVKRMPTECAL